MRKQQHIWQTIYEENHLIGSIADDKPSSHVMWFADFLKVHRIVPPATILDVGSGKGRNAIYLAGKGFDVRGIDYIDTALAYAKKRATKEGVRAHVSFQHVELDATWPFQDSFFDASIDCFSSIDIETPEGRKIYCEELRRTLKPKGYALILVVAAEDEIEATFEKGAEQNSTIWPESGKFQKNYDEEELRLFYKTFTIVSFKKIQKKAQKLNKTFTTTIFRLVLQK